MNKITRILTLIMAIVMALCLTACGGTTAPEVTNAPETTVAPATEPVNVCETNGHTWVDATCETAKICDLCGETDGEALGHIWNDATYKTPKTCEICGAIEGEPLVSYFTEYGLDARILDKSGEYELGLPCATDNTKTTVAKITIEEYKTITSDETHEAMAGYEWRILTIKQHFDDENARKYGGNLAMYLWTDKYMSDPIDENADNEGLFDDGMNYCVGWNGMEYTDSIVHIAESVSDWMKDENGSKYLDVVVTVSIRVPVGYDGLVFGLELPTWEWPAGKYLHEVITDHARLFCFD